MKNVEDEVAQQFLKKNFLMSGGLYIPVAEAEELVVCWQQLEEQLKVTLHIDIAPLSLRGRENFPKQIRVWDIFGESRWVSEDGLLHFSYARKCNKEFQREFRLLVTAGGECLYSQILFHVAKLSLEEKMLSFKENTREIVKACAEDLALRGF